MRSWILKIFTSKWAQAIANLGGAIALASFLIVTAYQTRAYVNPLTIQIIFGGMSIILNIGIILYIYSRLYRRLSNRFFTITGERISYNKRFVYSIRLAYLENNYFLAVTWIKMSRMLVMFITASFLISMYVLDSHTHKATINIFGQIISVHSLIDSATILSLLSLVAAILMNLYEINIISRGVSRLRVHDYWRTRNKRVGNTP